MLRSRIGRLLSKVDLAVMDFLVDRVLQHPAQHLKDRVAVAVMTKDKDERWYTSRQRSRTLLKTPHYVSKCVWSWYLMSAIARSACYFRPMICHASSHDPPCSQVPATLPLVPETL
jgi:hypothetical protein